MSLVKKVDLKEKFKYENIFKTYINMKDQFIKYLDELVDIIEYGGKKNHHFEDTMFEEYEIDVLEKIKDSIVSSNEILRNDDLNQLPQLKDIIEKFQNTDNILTYYYIHEDLEILLKQHLGSDFNDETVAYKLDRIKFYLDKLIDILLPLDSIIIHLNKVNDSKMTSIGNIELQSGRLYSELTISEFVVLYMNLPDYLQKKLSSKLIFEFFKKSKIYINGNPIRGYSKDAFRKAQTRKKGSKYDSNRLNEFVEYLIEYHPQFKQD